MSDDLLQHIQQLQFADQPEAERLLMTFITETLGLAVVEVRLRPLATSLNSFNGFMKLADGRSLFFKTHTETDTVINEYYHASLLADAGYPIIRPIYSSTETGKQLLVYDLIEAPAVFDVAWNIEMGDPVLFDVLTPAQHDADDHLCAIYKDTLVMQTAEDAGKAAVHQLFYHRLTGGRYDRFYAPDQVIHLVSHTAQMREVLSRKWVINGQVYADTLSDIVQRAIDLLQPAVAGPAIIGHGDAHNGNVFLENKRLLYFDPAFAGLHHPLLDLTKPLFHNVFAMWMYFPLAKREQVSIQLDRRADAWHVEYDYPWHPVREMFLDSKVQRVLIPTLIQLQQQGWLRADWRAYLKAALFCCPFLTMNLTDATKFPPEIALLGLTMSIEMGAESHVTRSRVDQLLDQVAEALN